MKNCKVFTAFIPIIICAVIFASCSLRLTNEEDVVNCYRLNKATFINAVKSGDFTEVKKLKGVEKVSKYDKCVEFSMCGEGFGSSTHYYGIFYSEDNDKTAVNIASFVTKLEKNGKGYCYVEEGGDNEYYVEPLSDHFFYYEAHF